MASRDWVVVGISHTGRTRDTFDAIKIAKEHGAKTICITNFMKSPIASISDVGLVTVSPETMFLKEAVTSRIAHVALLDSLFTAVALANYAESSSRLENMARVLDKVRLSEKLSFSS
jgi:DNA-binding MurR/RpiR family transcriptional regulator